MSVAEHQERRPGVQVVVQRRIDVVSSGNGAYLETFLKTLRRAGLRVTIVFAPRRSFGNLPWATAHPRFESLSEALVWPGSVRLGRTFVSTSPSVWASFAVRLWREVLRRAGIAAGGIYSYLGDPLEEREAEQVAAVCNRSDDDVTIVEYSALGLLLRRLRKRRIKGVLMHDLLADRGVRFRERGLTPDFLEIPREREAEWVSAADLCIFASASERAAFAPLLPRAKTAWLPPEPPRYGRCESDGPVKVVYLGARHAGNEDSLNHFVDDIWPAVRAECDALELWVVGAIGLTLRGARKLAPGVKVLGRIENLAEIGGMNSIGVAPARLATGVSIKVAQYLMLGMPCVAYPRALEGFGDVLSDLVIAAENPKQFARGVVALARDPARRLRLSAAAGAVPDRLSDRAVVSLLRDLVWPPALTRAAANY